MRADGVQMISELLKEPIHSLLTDTLPQTLTIKCIAIADTLKCLCDKNGANIHFRPTYMFQSTVYKFNVTNESHLPLPIKWEFDEIKRRSTSSIRLGTGGKGNVVVSLPIA